MKSIVQIVIHKINLILPKKKKKRQEGVRNNRLESRKHIEMEV